MGRLERAIRQLFVAPRWPPAYLPVRCHVVLSYDENYFSAEIFRRARVAYEAAKRNPVADDLDP